MNPEKLDLNPEFQPNLDPFSLEEDVRDGEDDHDQKNTKITMSVRDDYDDDSSFPIKNQASGDHKSKTPVLDFFSRDLTKLAEESKIDPVIGREKEIERVCQILSRRKKNNPILIGEPGVGKSAIADGLALRIVQRKVSRALFNKRVFTLDLADLVSGTKYRGQFEERVKSLISEIEREKDIILFIDEIHTIVGAGGSGSSLDASNMFKPALARGDIQIIGATTLDEYRKYIEKDGALERRFQKVVVEPATTTEALMILEQIKGKYEQHHNVIYTEAAIISCVELTNRFITDRHLPDKALDALDESGSRVHISNVEIPKEITDIEGKILDIKHQKTSVVKLQKYEEAARLRDLEKNLLGNLKIEKEKWEEFQKNNKQIVTEENVAQVVSMMTGIPLQRISRKETDRLSKMSEMLMGKVIGQDEAVNKVVKAIQRGRVGMSDPKKPIFTGMLIGNSGVGKTELAKQLCKYLFDTEDSLLRLDMSEFMEKISITRIQGSSPGYIGYDDATFLDMVRRKPYSIILLDEIEKAHQDVFNLFLQVLDDGHMTDSHGRKVSFKNCIILMTSNVGTKALRDFGGGIGFASKSSQIDPDSGKYILEKELKAKFPPEFINRLDEIIYFKDLDKDSVIKITDIELAKTINRAKKIGYDIIISDALRDHLATIGYDKEYGARPLKRCIQKWIDDSITEYIISSDLKPNSKLSLDYNKEKDKTEILVISPPKRSKK